MNELSLISEPQALAQCQRARQSRDARFDGRFFIAVTTTGIYCRPICPAQPPLEKNVRYYASAAAAEVAGFRPCLRCRPETAPGTPAWLGTGATVARALRLIEEGALDEQSVAELAARLGVGERYLRKLFTAQVGASPQAVAQIRRLHLAKQLLSETSLSMTEIAQASGFSSVRRFNAAFAQTYARAPNTLRRRPATASEAGVCSLRLNFRQPWSFEQFRRHFALRRIGALEQVGDDYYVRTFRIGAARGWLRVRVLAESGQLALDVSASGLAELPALIARVRRMFDLDADPALVADHLSGDATLAPLLARWPGLRLPTAFDPFEQAVRAIVGQQVTVKAAVTITGRLVEKFGERLDGALDGGPWQLFPTPEALAEADLVGIGMPGKRVQTLQGFARAVAEGRLVLNTCRGVEALLQELQALPGVGPWTAQYIALRAFGEPDAFPASDLGLLKAKVWGEGGITAKALAERATSWSPWRAYAAVYLWRSYEGEA